MVRNVFSAHHFDNNRIWESNGGIAFVNAIMLDTRSRLAQWNANRSFLATLRAITALYKLGRAIHAVQDFYAHSNYAEYQDGVWVNSDQVPFWEGEDYSDGTSINNREGSFYLPGLQTGYYVIPLDSGGNVRHDVLNKDDPTSPEGEVDWCTWFTCWTQYKIVSGQFFSTGISDNYGVGLAPRHTYRAIYAALHGTSVFADYPPGVEPDVEGGADYMAIINELELDSRYQAISQQLESGLASFDNVDFASFSADSFDEETGLPHHLASVASPSFSAPGALRVWPSPSRGTWLVEVVPGREGLITTTVHDAAGRLMCREQKTGGATRATRFTVPSTGSLPVGVYFVRARGNGFEASIRVLVTR